MAYQAPDDLKSRLKHSYDAIAPAYNNWTTVSNPRRLQYLEKLLNLLSIGKPESDNRRNVLELGCGAGIPVTEMLLSYTKFEFNITANDISTTQIATGKERLGEGDRIRWIEGDMMALEFADQSFDAVIGLYSLIHLPREEQAVLLGRIWQWLKPGGLILFNFSAEGMEGDVMEKWLGEEGWMFWSGWGADATREKIEKLGFQIVLGEVSKDDVDAAFLWVIARKP